jgi:hypothetical protein
VRVLSVPHKFFIDFIDFSHSPKKMRVKDARTLLRAPAASVHLIVGRRRTSALGLGSSGLHLLAANSLANSSTSGSRTALSASSTSSLTALSEQPEDLICECHGMADLILAFY